MILTNRNDILNRGVEEIIIREEFIEKMDSKVPLRLKMGFDPSAPDIHVGHAVGLRKLRQLQEIGHKVVLIVGDWTAQIGDPSGRSQTRKMLSAEEVRANAETYLQQFFKIIDKDRTEIRWQTEWFGDFNLTNVIELTSKFTVAQILARDDFAKRFSQNHPISITELLYPLLQGYDSVAIQSDVEFGGTDQKFNLLVGRELQQMNDMDRQHCFIMPLLPGTDGIQKMSKSLGNYIGIAEPGTEIYGKVMSIPDNLIMPYFEYLTDIPSLELNEMAEDLASGSYNPMEAKKRVAHNLVEQYHGLNDANDAQIFFEKTVQNRETPDNIKTYRIPISSNGKMQKLSNLLVDSEMVSSAGEARRLIQQGAVKLDDQSVNKNILCSELSPGILKVGRRKYLRLV